jgi:RNA polymerase sigma factor (sigma-70 family)
MATARCAAPADIEERALLRSARRGDPSAREQIVRAYAGLVRRIAVHYGGLGLGVDDLAQEGAIGLLEAIDRYDESRGAAFETFARLRIRRAITDALTDQARPVRLPKHVVERFRTVTRTTAQLMAKDGHAPTTAEIAEATAIPANAVEAVRALPTVRASLDAPLTEEGSTMLTLMEDPTAEDPEAEALAAQRRETIETALARLPHRYRHVIERRYGFDPPAASLIELADELHLSPQRIRAIEQAALFRLGRALETDAGFAAVAPPARRDHRRPRLGRGTHMRRRPVPHTARSLTIASSPPPVAGTRSTVPSSTSTRRRTIASPRPLPSPLRPRQKRSNARRSPSGSSPGP